MASRESAPTARGDLQLMDSALANLLKEVRPYERFWAEQLESAKPVPFPTRFFRPTENRSSLPSKHLHEFDLDAMQTILGDANLKMAPVDALLLLSIDLIHRLSNWSENQYWVKINVEELETRIRGNFEHLCASAIYSFAKPDPKHDDIVMTLRRRYFDLQEQKLQYTFRRDIMKRAKLNLPLTGVYLTTPGMTIKEFGEVFPGNNWQYILHFPNGITMGFGAPADREGLRIGTIIAKPDVADPIDLELIGHDIGELIKAVHEDPEEGIDKRSNTFVPCAMLAYLEKVIQEFEFTEDEFYWETDRTGISSCDLGNGVNVLAVINRDIKHVLYKYPSFPEHDGWEKEFDALYADMNDDEVYAGWKNYVKEEPLLSKSEPIPIKQMEEWVHYSVESIKAIKPEHVLEIGAGTGLIFRHLAKSCESYVATDISKNAVEYLKHYVHRKKWGDTVTVKKREASEFEPEENGAYDTIILNSVIRFFPQGYHLTTVLENVLGAAKPGGRIFIGDVRNKTLERNLHADIGIEQIHEECEVTHFQEDIGFGVEKEAELSVHPDYFRLFAKKHADKVDHVVIQLRRGKYHNEMTRYRYDAILYLKGADLPYENKKPHEILWNQLATGGRMDAIEKLLALSEYGHYLIREIPNARLSMSILAMKFNVDKPKTIFKEEFAKIRKEYVEDRTEPEDLVKLGERFGFKARLIPSRCDPTNFDILFYRKEDINTHYFEDVASYEFTPEMDYELLANNPTQSLNMQHIYGEFLIHLNKSIEKFQIQMPTINFVEDLKSKKIIF